MADLQKNPDACPAGFETSRLSLAAGWKARVALSDSTGNQFTTADWARCLSDPESLSINGEILKSDGKIAVLTKKINISAKPVAVVVKSQSAGTGLKNRCRSLLPAKAIRNFATATKLCINNIPTPRPLVSLQRKKGIFTTQSIYISEYVQNSTNLYHFLRENLYSGHRQSGQKAALKKDLARQIAQIFASLHKAGLWHRDAKASNFIVSKDTDGRYKIVLVDMDGIKKYRLKRDHCRYRGLYKLAATLLWCGGLNMTDYLRTFIIYSNLTGLDKSRRRRLFAELARRAVALRLLTMAKTAMQTGRCRKKTGN